RTDGTTFLRDEKSLAAKLVCGATITLASLRSTSSGCMTITLTLHSGVTPNNDNCRFERYRRPSLSGAAPDTKRGRRAQPDSGHQLLSGLRNARSQRRSGAVA